MKKSILYVLAFVFVLGLTLSAQSLFADHGRGKKGECPVGSDKSDCPMDNCPMKDCKKEGGESACPVTEKFMKKAHLLLEKKTELGLTDVQVNAIRSLKLEIKKLCIRQEAEMKIMMLDMKSKLKQEPFDADGVKAMIDQGMASMSTGAKQAVDAYSKLNTLVTAEQLAKLKADKE